MAEKKAAKKRAQTSAKFTNEERAAMRSAPKS